MSHLTYEQDLFEWALKTHWSSPDLAFAFWDLPDQKYEMELTYRL